jgi:hypothetical protein
VVTGGLPVLSLRDLMALAYLDGIERKARESAAERLTRHVRIDDTGRAPVVPLRPNGADHG